ncbi:MAG: hypothetical protein AVDCRST_MAG53-3019, partial [uncultured Solirubrobacteraceae bacterium]
DRPAPRLPRRHRRAAGRRRRVRGVLGTGGGVGGAGDGGAPARGPDVHGDRPRVGARGAARGGRRHRLRVPAGGHLLHDHRGADVAAAGRHPLRRARRRDPPGAPRPVAAARGGTAAAPGAPARSVDGDGASRTVGRGAGSRRPVGNRRFSPRRGGGHLRGQLAQEGPRPRPCRLGCGVAPGRARRRGSRRGARGGGLGSRRRHRAATALGPHRGTARPGGLSRAPAPRAGVRHRAAARGLRHRPARGARGRLHARHHRGPGALRGTGARARARSTARRGRRRRRHGARHGAARGARGGGCVRLRRRRVRLRGPRRGGARAVLARGRRARRRRGAAPAAPGL